MITAVDTNVLLDVFGADAEFGVRSRAALRLCIAEGSLIACKIVWAEVAAAFPSAVDATHAMEQLRVDFSPMNAVAAVAAGERFREDRQRGGERHRLVADFLIGAHAQTNADRLLTRDRGFYRAYFRDVTVLDPSTSA